MLTLTPVEAASSGEKILRINLFLKINNTIPAKTISPKMARKELRSVEGKVPKSVSKISSRGVRSTPKAIAPVKATPIAVSVARELLFSSCQMKRVPRMSVAAAP